MGSRVTVVLSPISVVVILGAFVDGEPNIVPEADGTIVLRQRQFFGVGGTVDSEFGGE